MRQAGIQAVSPSGGRRGRRPDDKRRRDLQYRYRVLIYPTRYQYYLLFLLSLFFIRTQADGSSSRRRCGPRDGDAPRDGRGR